MGHESSLATERRWEDSARKVAAFEKAVDYWRLILSGDVDVEKEKFKTHLGLVDDDLYFLMRSCVGKGLHFIRGSRSLSSEGKKNLSKRMGKLFITCSKIVREEQYLLYPMYTVLYLDDQDLFFKRMQGCYINWAMQARQEYADTSEECSALNRIIADIYTALVEAKVEIFTMGSDESQKQCHESCRDAKLLAKVKIDQSILNNTIKNRGIIPDDLRGFHNVVHSALQLAKRVLSHGLGGETDKRTVLSNLQSRLATIIKEQIDEGALRATLRVFIGVALQRRTFGLGNTTRSGYIILNYLNSPEGQALKIFLCGSEDAPRRVLRYRDLRAWAVRGKINADGGMKKKRADEKVFSSRNSTAFFNRARTTTVESDQSITQKDVCQLMGGS